MEENSVSVMPLSVASNNSLTTASILLPGQAYPTVTDLAATFAATGQLKVVDEGCDGEYTKSITLKTVHERVSHTPFRHLNDALNEGGDAITADVILQTVFFDDVIFG